MSVQVLTAQTITFESLPLRLGAYAIALVENTSTDVSVAQAAFNVVDSSINVTVSEDEVVYIYQMCSVQPEGATSELNKQLETILLQKLSSGGYPSLMQRILEIRQTNAAFAEELVQRGFKKIERIQTAISNN